MRTFMLTAITAFGLLVGSSAQACVDTVSHPLVTVDHFDPFAGAGAVRNFSLKLSSRAHDNGPVYVQFVDRGDALDGRKINGVVGPYAIRGSNGNDVVVSPGDLRPPTSTGLSSAWVRYDFPNDGDSASQAYLFRIEPGTAPAGIYDKYLDVRVACPRQQGGYAYETFSNAAEIHVAVDDLIKLVGSHNRAIDLGDLPIEGGPAKGMTLISLRASGPFSISARSQVGTRYGATTGLLLRRDGDGKVASDRVPYQISVNGVVVDSTGRTLRCAGDVSGVNVGVLTDAAPGAGKTAGDYRDVIEVTLTPDYYGQGVVSGRCDAH